MMLPAMLALTLLSPGAQEPPLAAPSPKAPADETLATRPASRAAAPSGSAEDDLQAGLAAFRKHQFRQAKEAFERAEAGDPSSAAAHFYLGYTIYKIAEPRKFDHAAKREALAHFAKAYELDPAFKPAWGPRG